MSSVCVCVCAKDGSGHARESCKTMITTHKYAPPGHVGLRYGGPAQLQQGRSVAQVHEIQSLYLKAVHRSPQFFIFCFVAGVSIAAMACLVPEKLLDARITRKGFPCTARPGSSRSANSWALQLAVPTDGLLMASALNGAA